MASPQGKIVKAPGSVYNKRGGPQRPLFGVPMKYIRQFFIIIAVTFAGELLSRLIPVPVPAGIYGLLILFFGLLTGLIPYEAVKETGKFLVEIMQVMFIPATVGLLKVWGIVKDSLLSYAVILVVTTFLVMAASGLVTQAVIRHGRRGAGQDAETAAGRTGEEARHE